MKNVIIFLFAFLLTETVVWGQETVGRKLVNMQVVDGDTMLYASLPAINISEKRGWRSRIAQSRYESLKRKVIHVYPYAKAAGEKLKYHNTVLTTLKTDAARSKYMKKVEKDINSTFGPELKDMTVSEGVILIKLIDRETGDTSYALLQEYRSQFSAFLWQGVARLFGHNLKNEYSAEGDEKAVEEIIQLIEDGVYEVASIDGY